MKKQNKLIKIRGIINRKKLKKINDYKRYKFLNFKKIKFLKSKKKI